MIKRGDYVLIKKPSNVMEHPTWIERNGNDPGMDIYDGLTVRVAEVFSSLDHYNFEIAHPPDRQFWTFNTNWATKVERNVTGPCKCSWAPCLSRRGQS